MPLSSFDFRARIVAADSDYLRRFDTVAVSGPSRWVFMTTNFATELRSKRVMNALPRSIITPSPKVGVDTLPGGRFPWQHAPLTG